MEGIGKWWLGHIAVRASDLDGPVGLDTGGRRLDEKAPYLIDPPASIGRLTPVMNRPSSEARKTTALLMSETSR